MEGRVVQRAECMPIQSTSYMNIKKEAIAKAGEPVSFYLAKPIHVIFTTCLFILPVKKKDITK